jgi:CubicO group peptidase (beta-lactamase class C family)
MLWRMTPTRRAFLQKIGLATAGLGLVSYLPGCRTAHRAETTSSLPRSHPEPQGVSPAGILAFLDAAAKQHEMHSFMLIRHGRVVAEHWWSPYGPEFRHTLYSLSKSFTSTAVGFAVAEGRLSVNDRVISFFAEDRPAALNDNLVALRVKDLLTMSVGNEKEPTQAMVRETNWVKTFLASPITHKPGSVFMYNSGATYVLSAIVQRVTSQRIVDYLKPRLFAPLGIEGATWETCPRGISIGGWGLSVRTEDIAKFAQLYLQKGVWHGKPVLPAAWVDEATTFKIQQPLPANPGRPNAQNDWLQGYCYQFWRCTHHGYRGDGAFGQYAIVLPEQDAVIAITSESKNMQGQLDLVWEHLLPAMRPQALPVDRADEAELRSAMATLAPPKGQATSAMARRVSGKTFKLETNELGLKGASFEFHKNECLLTFIASQSRHPLRCGFGRWTRGETALPGTPPRLVSGGAPAAGTPSKVAAAGAWQDENTFVAVLRYYESPHHDTVTCRFEGDKVTLGFTSSIAAMSPSPKDNRSVLQGHS